MRIKKKSLALIVLTGTIVAMAFYFNAIAAIDAPHNESTNVLCGKCHGQGLLQSFWGGSGMYSTVDELCLYCHTQPSCPLTHDTIGPQAITHKDSNDTVLAECITCHDPHYQKQKNYKNTDWSNLYLAYDGEITSYEYNHPDDYNPDGEDPDGNGKTYSDIELSHTSVLQYEPIEPFESITYKDGWNATRLTRKTWECRGAILFPNIKKLGFSYPIIEIDEQTITVKGDVTATYQYISLPTDFVVMYGQFIKDQIPLCSTTKAQSCTDDGDCPVGEECIVGEVKFFGPNGEGSFTDGAGNGICEICHTETTYHTNDGEGADHLEGSRCTDCHNHAGGLKPSGDCIGCHSYSIRGRASITQQFEANSHHVQGVTLDNTHCYECHWEAQVDGSINNPYHEGYNTDTNSSVSGAKVDLVIYGAGERPTTYTEDTTAIYYIANGSRVEIGKLNAHCLSCHTNQNNDTDPFIDGKTPKQYAWDGTSINEKYANNETVTWGKYTSVSKAAKKNITKAYSAHGRATLNSGGWSSTDGVDWIVPNTRNGSVNVACFDCHNSHGSTVGGFTTSYTSATTNGGILKDTRTGKGGYTTFYKPEYGGSPDDKNEYNAGAGLCFDCHLTASPGDKPWGYNATFGATQEIMGYRDTPYFGPSTSGAQQRFALKAFAAHQGGHFGASSALDGLPGNDSPEKTTINGLCTPCHDPHGVSPTINQEYAVPLLKGTWLTSLYKDDIAVWSSDVGIIRTDRGREGVHYNIDQNTLGTGLADDTLPSIQETDAEFAGLCMLCHQKGTLTNGSNGGAWKSMDRIHESVKDWGANSKHNFPCSKCHSPHSGRLPRLMVTNCLDSQHKTRTGYNPSPALSGSGSGNFDGCQSGECYELGYPGKHPGLDGPHGGSGSGRFPGSLEHSMWKYNIWDDPRQNVSCHEDQNPGYTDHSWNVKTMWSDDRPLIYSGPEAGSFTVDCSDDISAIITWTTISGGTSYVDYGFTDEHEHPDSPQGNDTMIRTHSITLTGLDNHKTYHYQVKSTGHLGSVITSEDHTFYVSITPTPPRLIRTPNVECSSSCDVTLQWEASSDPENDPLEYYVEIDEAIDFTGPDFNSGWITDTEWTLALPTDNTWYWRVKARDELQPDAESAWSGVDYFYVIQSLPPGPGIEESFETTKTCDSDGYEFSWTEAVGGIGCILDEDANIPGLAPLNAGSQCLKLADTPNCTASATWDYGSIVNRTYTKFYVYVESSVSDDDDVIATLSDGTQNALQVRLVHGFGPFGTLKFVFDVNTGVIEHFESSEISLNTWYRIWFYYDRLTDQWSLWLDDTKITPSWHGYISPGWSPAAGVRFWQLGTTDGGGHSKTIYYDRLVSSYYAPPGHLGTPVLIEEPDNNTLDMDVTLEWEEVTYPDNPVQYYVQIDDSSNFNSPDYGSGWLSETDAFCDGTQCSWTVSIDTYGTWYWRVLARDSIQTFKTSLWSTGDGFIIGPPPPGLPPGSPPTLVHVTDITSTIGMVNVELEWGSVTCPDGDPVEYYVEVDNAEDFSSPIYSSDWITGTSWTVSLPAGNTWHWRVKARDAVHTEAETGWSTDSFTIHLLVPMIEESFEGAGYEEIWTENVGSGCSLDPDSTIPGTAPPGAGSECLKLISDIPDYQAAISLDYITEITKTFTRMYLYVEAEGLANGDSKYIGALEDSIGNYAILFSLNKSWAGQLQLRFSVYNNGAIEQYYTAISIETWYKIDIKYDNTNNTWEWKLDGVVQDNGSLSGTDGIDHYTGVQKWNLGFPPAGDITATIYYDLFSVNTIDYLD